MFNISRINVTYPKFGALKKVPCNPPERALIMVKKTDMDELPKDIQEFILEKNASLSKVHKLEHFTTGLYDPNYRMGVEFDLTNSKHLKLSQNYLHVLNKLGVPSEYYILARKTVKVPDSDGTKPDITLPCKK
ncbi:MAG: hypothetical protein GX568_10760 [Candidatus Gastranaerophilales bacterium]|nr:hypothetical protein [Candidatus Gastranaerophilales bacterium]